MMRRGRCAGALLLGLMVAGVGEAAGQTLLVVGPRVGVVVSTMEFEDAATDAQTETLLGFQAGLSVGRALGRFFTGEVGLLLSREGFVGGGAHTGDLRRDQLGVPILLSVRIPTRISLHVSAGLSGKYALTCRQTGVPGVGDFSCDDPVMGAAWRRVDLAGLGGMGLEIPVGVRTLSADLLVSWGLRDLAGGGLIPGGARGVAVGISAALFSPWGDGGQGGVP